MLTKRFDFVASVGEDCACAGYLNRLGIRDSSGPLDWVDGSCFGKRTLLLLNEFKDYTNPKYIEKYRKRDGTHPINHIRSSPDIPRDQVHVSYINKYYGIKFHHDFIFRKPLAENLPLVQEKYNRRIDRFIEKIKSSRKVLFIFIARHKETKKVLKKCVAKMNQKYGQHKIHLLYIENRKGLMPNEIIKETYPDLTIAYINNISTDNSEPFLKLLGNIPMISHIIYWQIFCKDMNLNTLKYKLLFQQGRYWLLSKITIGKKRKKYNLKFKKYQFIYKTIFMEKISLQEIS